MFGDNVFMRNLKYSGGSTVQICVKENGWAYLVLLNADA